LNKTTTWHANRSDRRRGARHLRRTECALSRRSLSTSRPRIFTGTSPDQISATTDPIAERVRKTGGTTLRSIGQMSQRQRSLDNDAEFVTPLDMLAEL